eukprot:TRINITY_DN105194_c3_g1_i1.p1 TRINITY_DN105194_c3_g1~~TRINITY_DN105194_c3_g1_i1.p1  ORF type:complete len:1042 (-),score=138.06 TRINITY_DN105194_c3_g1_i1:6642-9767(-)
MDQESDENEMEWQDSDEELSVGFPPMEESANTGYEMKPIDIKSHIKGPIQAISMSEECILLATKGNLIVRKKLSPNEEYETLQVPCRSEMQILKIYTDVHGFHSIIVCSRNEYYYLSLAGSTITPLKSLKSFNITAIAFSLNTTVFSTNDILFGTSDGSFYLYSIEMNATLGNVEAVPKKVFQLPQATPIHGLAFDLYDCILEGGTEKSFNIAFILAVTNDSLYQFVGELPFMKLFEKYNSSLELNKHKKTAPKGTMEQTELKICHTYKGEGVFELHSFAWKTGVGVIHGKFRDKEDLKARVIIKEMPLEPYKRKGTIESNEIEIPESIALNEYSVYMLYPESLTVISKISHEITQTESFRHNDPMKHITFEASSRSLWLNSSKSLIRIMFQNSKKDLWQQHVESGNYTDALRHCKEHDPKHYGKVAGMYANAMFKSGKFSEAAILYAESSCSFEDVVLKFLRAGLNDELEIYLTKKLEEIKHVVGKKTQRVVLCTWLVELRLDKLNKLGAAAEGELPENAGAFKRVQKQEAIELYQRAVEEFKTFLTEYEEDLETEIIYQLLQSHGRLKDCLSFASQKKNYEAVVLHHINNRDYKAAIEVVNDVDDEKTKNALMVRYASVFMKHETKMAIDSLSRYYQRINVEDLIASLISIDSKDRIFANSYIKLIMDRANNKLLFNLYLFFLAESRSPEGIEELHSFLDQQEAFHHNSQPLNIDKDFALNVCKHFGLIEAQVKVYGLLDFYEESVKLALKHKRVELAKKYANFPSDEKIRKKLWIEIAKAVMQASESDVKAGFDVITESKILTLGDVLQFLSPKMKLSAFKDDLVSSLQSYGTKIREIKRQMSDYSKSAEEITMQLKELQNSCIPVPTDQYCDKCKKPLLGNERFYIFPCLHSFHRQCLVDWMFEFKMYVPKFKLARLERINEFMKKVAVLEKKREEEENELMLEQQQNEPKGFLSTLGGLFMRSKSKHTEEQKQPVMSAEDQETLKLYEHQLEVLLTDDCMLCGNLFIESVDVPFDSSEECVWAIQEILLTSHINEI